MDPFRASSSTATRLPTIGVDFSTPAGLAKAFAIGATECLMDAKDLQKGWPDRTGQYIITFHAIELGLKAFLIAAGLTEEWLSKKPYGHDLVALYNKAKTNGLFLSTPHVDEQIAWINEWHCQGVKIRYEFTTQRTLPLCETLFPLAEEIISVAGGGNNAQRS